MFKISQINEQINPSGPFHRKLTTGTFRLLRNALTLPVGRTRGLPDPVCRRAQPRGIMALNEWKDYSNPWSGWRARG
jgi:hypothetical protein